MNIKYQLIAITLFFLTQSLCYGQLGFCTGSKGDPVFKENFGSGVNYGPALPFGTTNYAYVSSGFPQDGQYTLYYRTNLISGNWLYSLDHTPDTEVDGINGKSLIVNASNVSGEFYKKIVSGLCINTTFEFTAWAINIYNSNSNGCSGTGIPVNIKFEIWDATETVLLKSGDTGNINGTSLPIWTQFGMVFTTTSQTSVVLKMKNNGTGGCGNDLAIDDIMFRSCGDFTTITSPLSTGNVYTACQNSGPISTVLNAVTSGTSSHVYQWQESVDGIIWTSIPGANSSSFTTPGITSAVHYRAKVAQDIANLNNSYCSTISEEFSFVFDSPIAPARLGDKTICNNDPIPNLAVTTNSSLEINWYDSPVGGTILQSNSPVFLPTTSGTYYAESRSISGNCKSVTRTAVSLLIVPQLTATISAAGLSICSGTSTTISINGTPNATISYSIGGGLSQTILLSALGLATITTSQLNAATVYTFSTISLINGSTVCSKVLTDVITISIIQSLTANISGAATICSGSTSPITFMGTPNSELTYNINNGVNQTLLFDASGIKIVNSAVLYTDTTYTLVQVATQGSSICTKLLTDSILIKVNALPIAIITGSKSICSGSFAQILISGTPNSTLTYTIDNGSNQTYSIDATGIGTINTPNLFSNSTYSFLNITTNALPSCSKMLSGITVLFTINNSVTVTYTGNTTFCSGTMSSIALSSNSANTNFSWTVVQNGTTGAIDGVGNSINQQLQTTTASTGTAIYTVTPNLNNCTGSPISIPVTIHALPTPNIADGAICLDQTTLTAIQPYLIDTQLSATTTNFSWYYNGIVLPLAIGSTNQASLLGIYGVIATDINTSCSSGLVEIHVIETLPGQSISLLQTESFSENATILVDVTGGQGPFLYQLDHGVFQSSNTFNAVASGLHTITVIDDSNCTHLFETITIVDYAHFFTPNNDGINDTWNIKNVNSKSKITIIDRYGKVIKQMKTNDLGWDGTFNGKNLPADDYWFTIEYLEQGTVKIFKSHFTLKR